MTAPVCTTQDLRYLANTKPDVFHPFWVNQAQNLMAWAADVIDAGDAVIKEFKDMKGNTPC